MIFPVGATSQSVDVQIVDDSGLPVTGLVAATFPTLTYSLAGANADVAFPALSDLASLTTAYASGGVKERTNGYYRLDVPNGVFTTAGQVRIMGEATGKHVICPVLDVGTAITPGTGAGQISVDGSGNAAANVVKYAGQTAAVGSDNLPKVGLWSILGSALSETVAGYLAAAFKKFFNVATPTLTTGGTDQTGDSYANVAAIKAQTDKLTFSGSNLLSIVEAYAAGQDPWTQIKTAVPSATPTANTVEEKFQLIGADEYTDTGVNPWARVLMVKGSGGIGVGTELRRQKLYDSAGAAITDTTTVIAGAHV